MRKLRLELDALAVESFEPVPARGTRTGTIQGYLTGDVGSCFDPSCKPALCYSDACPGGPAPTQDVTCPATCAATCANTCAYTCDDATCGCGGGGRTQWDTCGHTCLCQP